MLNNFETVTDMRNMSMNHDYETGVALSDTVNKTCVKRPLAEKSQWRHFWLAIKPRYLGNHASQIKKLLWITIMKSWSLSKFYKKFYKKKQQIKIQKSYQFINVVNGVSRSHKTANIFFSFNSVA